MGHHSVVTAALRGWPVPSILCFRSTKAKTTGMLKSFLAFGALLHTVTAVLPLVPFISAPAATPIVPFLVSQPSMNADRGDLSVMDKYASLYGQFPPPNNQHQDIFSGATKWVEQMTRYPLFAPDPDEDVCDVDMCG